MGICVPNGPEVKSPVCSTRDLKCENLPQLLRNISLMVGFAENFIERQIPTM